MLNINNISIISKDKCCGCSACYNICPKKAIKMVEDSEGFLSPIIDDEDCINCGQCLKSCPVLNMIKPKQAFEKECYAAMANDEIRMKSSSGGVFTLLANFILDKGGYVCGAAFKNDWSVQHIIINKKEDLHKIRGSKYVQSEIGECFVKIKRLLKENKYVLFSGTPCQVTALKSFLKEDYDNLLTIDLLCHGVPSPGVWSKYLNECFSVADIRSINFRDKKELGWICKDCSITFKDGSKILSDDYTKLFHKSIILRRSCEDCQYSKLPRPADITLGDWWGISEYARDLNDQKGLSFVLINTKKGKKIYSLLSGLKSYPIKLKNNYNNGYIHIGNHLHSKREDFFRYYNDYPLKTLSRLTADNKYDVCLLTTFYSKNYGAILVAYAVNYLIKKLGYSVLMLQKLKNQWGNYPINDTIPINFAKKHYFISESYENENDLVQLNDKCSNFVVGSDQMFSYLLNLGFSFLEFAENSKNKIAFATSFGHDKFDLPEKEIVKKQFLLNRFNHIALREKTDNLCNKIFKINAIQVIDPSLMVEREEYEKLADTVDTTYSEPYLLTYILDLNKDKIKAIKYIAKSLNLKIINIQNLDFTTQRSSELSFDKNYTPEEFLHLYKNAQFIVTDSYHGTCFAIKFNKNFISMINVLRGGMRYKMFEPMKIMDRFLDNPLDVMGNKIIFQNVDFSIANEYIKLKSKEAILWLKEALKNNPKKGNDLENYFDVIIKEFQQKSHSLDNKMEELQNHINLLNGQVKKINSNSKKVKKIIERIFSIKNTKNKKHKLVTILGIKLKFKRRIA